MLQYFKRVLYASVLNLTYGFVNAIGHINSNGWKHCIHGSILGMPCFSTEKPSTIQKIDQMDSLGLIELEPSPLFIVIIPSFEIIIYNMAWSRVAEGLHSIKGRQPAKNTINTSRPPAALFSPLNASKPFHEGDKYIKIKKITT